MAATQCACLSTWDAQTCFELRYYGHSPAAENDPEEQRNWEDYPERCMCPCHDWGEDDEILEMREAMRWHPEEDRP